MKRLFLTVPIYVSLNLCAGQNFFNKLYVNPRVNYSIATFTNSKSPFIEDNYSKKNQHSTSYGFLVQYSINKKFSIFTGYQRDIKGITGLYNFVREDGTYRETRSRRTKIINRYNSIPFFLRMNLKESKMQFIVDFGFYLSKLTENKIWYTFDEVKTGSGSIIEQTHERFYGTHMGYTNDFDLGLVLGTGLSYSFAPRLSLQLNPQVSIGLRKLDKRFSNDSRIIVINSGPLIVENDYFDLSSMSRNLLFSLNLCLSYKLVAD